MNYYLIKHDGTLQHLSDFEIVVNPRKEVRRIGSIGGAVSAGTRDIPGEYCCPISQIQSEPKSMAFEVVNESGTIYQGIIGRINDDASAINLIVRGPLAMVHQIMPDRMEEFEKCVRETSK